jgi:uncharacterized protein (DUF1501 family)
MKRRDFLATLGSAVGALAVPHSFAQGAAVNPYRRLLILVELKGPMTASIPSSRMPMKSTPGCGRPSVSSGTRCCN